MLVRVQLPGPMEVSSDLEKINFEIAPVFYRANGKPMFLYLDVVDARGEVIGEYALSLSGANGQISLNKREAVVASYDAALLSSSEETSD